MSKQLLFTTIIFFITLLPLNNQLYSQEEEGEIIVISEKVGEVIDLEERNLYDLYKGIKGFQSAIYLRLPDSSYVLKIVYRDVTTDEEKFRRQSVSEIEIKKIKEYIDNFEKVQINEYTQSSSEIIDEDKANVSFTYQPDIFIRSVDIKNFGTGIHILDLNKDSLNDILVVQGIHGGVLDRGNRSYLFSGRLLKNNSIISTMNASMIIQTGFGEKIIRPDYEVSDNGISVGDFNGDGCDDLLFFIKYLTKMTISDPVLKIIFGKPEFFNNTGKTEIKNLKELTDTKIYSSNFNDFDPYDNNYIISVTVTDLNFDQKDDIILSSTTADVQTDTTNLSNAGKIFIVFGRDKFSDEIDLSNEADITINGNEKKKLLGSSISIYKSSDSDPHSNIFVNQEDKINFIPNVEKLIGTYNITDVPNIVYLNCISDLQEVYKIIPHIKSDSVDLIIGANLFGNSNMDYEGDSLSMVRSPLIHILPNFNLDTKSGLNIDDLSDVSIFTKTPMDKKKLTLHDIEYLDYDYLPDAIFRTLNVDDKFYCYFLYNIFSYGKELYLEESNYFSITIENENPLIPFFQNINFNGNEIPDHIAVEPNTSLEGFSLTKKPMKKCGKIYIYFDKPFNKECLQNLRQEADLVISGEQSGEIFGKTNSIRIRDYDRDEIDDLIVLSPFRDYKGPFRTSKNDAGGVYIYSGKTLWNYYKDKAVK